MPCLRASKMFFQRLFTRNRCHYVENVEYTFEKRYTNSVVAADNSVFVGVGLVTRIPTFAVK